MSFDVFLQKFVDPKIPWAHFDVYGWAPSTKPWVHVGGEAQGIRALFEVLKLNSQKVSKK